MARELPETIGPYRVDGVLGRGASGVVYRGWDAVLDRPVAIKLLTDDLDPEARGRFEIEAKAAARIVHPNVVQVFGAGTHEGDAYMTQELVEGLPLSAILDARQKLSWAAAVDVALQVAEGLAAAETVGVLHRDIKPHNLLVTEMGLVKIADFGLAKILDAPSSYTESGTTLGTPHYMSPEQGQGRALDSRADQYALGATLYHLLTGAPPFDADTAVATLFKHASDPLPPLAEHAPECPEALAAIVERMLAKAPDDRYASFEAVIEVLEEQRGGEAEDIAQLVFEATKPEEEPPARRPWTRAAERFALAATAIIAIAVIAAATYTPTPVQTSGVRLRSRAIEPAIPVSVIARQRDPFTAVAKPAPPPPRRISKTAPRSSVGRHLDDLSRGGARAIRAARALGEKSDQRATMPLVDALRGKDPALAVAAADALGELGDIRAIEPLAEAAEGSSSADVREAARRAHRRLWHVEDR